MSRKQAAQTFFFLRAPGLCLNSHDHRADGCLVLSPTHTHTHTHSLSLSLLPVTTRSSLEVFFFVPLSPGFFFYSRFSSGVQGAEGVVAAVILFYEYGLLRHGYCCFCRRRRRQSFGEVVHGTDLQRRFWELWLRCAGESSWQLYKPPSTVTGTPPLNSEIDTACIQGWVGREGRRGEGDAAHGWCEI